MRKQQDPLRRLGKVLVAVTIGFVAIELAMVVIAWLEEWNGAVIAATGAVALSSVFVTYFEYNLKKRLEKIKEKEEEVYRSLEIIRDELRRIETKYSAIKSAKIMKSHDNRYYKKAKTELAGRKSPFWRRVFGWRRR